MSYTINLYTLQKITEFFNYIKVPRNLCVVRNDVVCFNSLPFIYKRLEIYICKIMYRAIKNHWKKNHLSKTNLGFILS